MSELSKTVSEQNTLHSPTLDILSIGRWRWDWANGTLYVDEVWARLLALSNGQTISMDWWLERTHPEDLARFNAALKSISNRETKKLGGEFRFKAPCGEWKHMHLYANWDPTAINNLPSSQIVGVLTPGYDYSAASAERGFNTFYNYAFKESFENAPIGLALSNIDGRFKKVNSQLEEIFGYSELELMEMAFGDITHPDDLTPNLKATSDLA